MTPEQAVQSFLSGYSETVSSRALQLRALVLAQLPGITEVVDLPAKMIHYCYGPKYADLICGIIPSAKGLKLGFNRGVDLPDPQGLLEGKGKISRYVVIPSGEPIASEALIALIHSGLAAYKVRTGTP